MADTRNNNMPGNYCLQQKSMQHILDYELYEHSQYGHAVNPAIPCVGYTPSHMPRNTLSNNPVEIESQLFGNTPLIILCNSAPSDGYLFLYELNFEFHSFTKSSPLVIAV